MKHRMKKEHKNHNGLGWLISLLLALLVFVVLVIFSNSISGEKNMASVVISKRDIEANEIIGAEEFHEYFQIMEVPANLAYEGTYTRIRDLTAGEGIYVTEKICANTIINEAMVTEENRMTENFENPVAMGIRAKSFEKAAGGILRRGDLVDLCVTDEYDMESSIRVYILQAFDSSGNRLTREDAEVAVAFNILIEREAYGQVAGILAKDHDFDLVKISDVD